jgi:hypothetical protein
VANEGNCRPCGPGCSTCDQLDTSLCTSCLSGSFLNTSQMCAPCLAPCLECSVSASTCTRCPPGQMASNGICLSCPANCVTCTSSTYCTTCIKGSVVSNGTCVSCLLDCSVCDPLDITRCLGCDKGLELVQGKCQACPANCLECSNG